MSGLQTYPNVHVFSVEADKINKVAEGMSTAPCPYVTFDSSRKKKNQWKIRMEANKCAKSPVQRQFVHLRFVFA